MPRRTSDGRSSPSSARSAAPIRRTTATTSGNPASGSLDKIAPHSRNRVDPRETLRSLLAQFGRRATAAGNITVVHCEIGSAPAIARALDRVDHPLVVGTLAGDDTLLVAARDAEGAQALARELG